MNLPRNETTPAGLFSQFKQFALIARCKAHGTAELREVVTAAEYTGIPVIIDISGHTGKINYLINYNSDCFVIKLFFKVGESLLYRLNDTILICVYCGLTRWLSEIDWLIFGKLRVEAKILRHHCRLK